MQKESRLEITLILLLSVGIEIEIRYIIFNIYSNAMKNMSDNKTTNMLSIM